MILIIKKIGTIGIGCATGAVIGFIVADSTYQIEKKIKRKNRKNFDDSKYLGNVIIGCFGGGIIGSVAGALF
jgi:hypothetical protein